MPTLLALGAIAPPIVLAAAAAAGTAARAPRVVADRAILAAAAGLALAASVAAAVVLAGPLRTPLLGGAGLGVSLYVDALSATLLVLVSFVGLTVVRYSRNYLDGDPGQVRFTRWLLLTLAAVQVVVTAGNLVLLVAALAGTSLALGRLLMFYGARPAARRAARKKFVASRLADLCLLLAAALLFSRFGTLEIPDLLAAARGAAGVGTPPTAAVLLIIVAATLHSAQLPLHGWILEVMETPTPVSALLHAGIVNAGGFLALRLADVLVLDGPALSVLAIVGAATALFGSLAMLTQTSVKVQLAYSTVGQMGFMLLQCGLGAFSSALLHIVAHSLYKAHAFLSSGSVMDLARAAWKPREGAQPSAAWLALAVLAVVGVAVGVAALFGFHPGASPAPVAFGCILLMGLVHLLASAVEERPSGPVLASAGLKAIGVAAVYFALQALMVRLMAGSLPLHAPAGSFGVAIAAFVVLAFAAVTVFQSQIMRSADAPFWVAAHVHLRNGLYLNTLANRLVLAWWPRRTAPAASDNA